jgi:flagellar basal body-associated protein FliL
MGVCLITDNFEELRIDYDEEKAEEDIDLDQLDDEDDEEETPEENDEQPKKEGFIKRNKKKLIGFGIATVVLAVAGGAYCYFRGKKPEKIALPNMTGDNDKVVNFADEAAKLAKDMVENPDNYKVGEM